MNYLTNRKGDGSSDSTMPSEAISSEEVTKITGQELDKYFKKGREFKIKPSKKPIKK